MTVLGLITHQKHLAAIYPACLGEFRGRSSSFFTARRYASAVYAVVMCPFVCWSVCPSVSYSAQLVPLHENITSCTKPGIHNLLHCGCRKLESLGYCACGVVCVILRLAVFVELRLVRNEWTDGQMMTAYTALAQRRAVKPHVQTSQNFLYMLNVVVSQSSSKNNAINYAFMALWMTSYFHFHMMGLIGQYQRRRYVLSSSPRGGTGGDVCCLRLPC